MTDNNKKYLVKVRNGILGNSDHIMTKEQAKNFNLVAYYLCEKVDSTGGAYAAGMWEVEEYRQEAPQ